MVVLEIVAWAAVVTMAALLVTQLIGWSGVKLAVSLQALTPYVLAPAAPITVAALIAQRWLLGAAAGALVIALVVMCLPVRWSSGQRSAPDGAQRLRLFHGNLLYYNGRTAELGRVVHRLDADVLAFTEYTPTHAGGLYVSPLSQAFPYRIEHPEAKAGGSALWSRFPLTEISPPPAMYQSTAARVDAAGGVTVYVVHPPNPLDHLHHWRDELHGLAGLYDAHDPPAIVIGDLNATYWHPPFRRIQTAGWRDAHRLTGKRFLRLLASRPEVDPSDPAHRPRPRRRFAGRRRRDRRRPSRQRSSRVRRDGGRQPDGAGRASSTFSITSESDGWIHSCFVATS